MTLPGILADVAAIAGEAAALQLMATHGGARVSIPAIYRPGCWLEASVGEVAARKIIDHFRVLDGDGRPTGLKQIDIPIGHMGTIGRARRQARIAFSKAIEDGCGVRTAARRAGLSQRTAWEIRAKIKRPSDDGQGSLF